MRRVRRMPGERAARRRRALRRWRWRWTERDTWTGLLWLGVGMALTWLVRHVG